MEFVGLPVVLELDKARDTVEVSFLLLLHDEPEGHVVDSRDTIHAHPLELVVTETKEAVDLFEVLPHDDLPHSRVNLVEVISAVLRVDHEHIGSRGSKRALALLVTGIDQDLGQDRKSTRLNSSH